LGVDALAQLAQTNLVGFNPSQQLTSERVDTILSRSEVSWPTALREINAGLATVGTVAYEDNTNALEALQALQVSENGRFYASRNGMVVFDPRTQVSFGTALAVLGGTAVTDVPIRSLNNLYGAETVLNRISVQVEGSSVLSVVNGTASQTEYGIKNFALNNLPLVNDAAGSALAVALLARY
jgi:ABC-type phosphonate transport system ATPase subunit